MPIDRKRIFISNPESERPTWVVSEETWLGGSTEWMFEVPTWATDDDINEYITLMKKYADWADAEDAEFDFWRSKDRDHGDGRYH